jgi:hypothetical protein
MHVDGRRGHFRRKELAHVAVEECVSEREPAEKGGMHMPFRRLDHSEVLRKCRRSKTLT